MRNPVTQFTIKLYWLMLLGQNIGQIIFFITVMNMRAGLLELNIEGNAP